MTDPGACQEYQPEWLLPADSEVARWFEVKNTLYPSFGEPGYVMVKQVTTIYTYLAKINKRQRQFFKSFLLKQGTSWPYFGVKLSCVCFMFAFRKNSL